MTFLKMLSEDDDRQEPADEDDETSDDKAVAAMGILNTIETVLDMMEEEREITVQLEGIVTPAIAHVLKTRKMGMLNNLLVISFSIQDIIQ